MGRGLDAKTSNGACKRVPSSLTSILVDWSRSATYLLINGVKFLNQCWNIVDRELMFLAARVEI